MEDRSPDCPDSGAATRFPSLQRVATGLRAGRPIDCGQGRTRYELVRLHLSPSMSRDGCDAWDGWIRLGRCGRKSSGIPSRTSCAGPRAGARTYLRDRGDGPRGTEPGSRTEVAAMPSRPKEQSGGATGTGSRAERTAGFGKRPVLNESEAGPTHTWSGLHLFWLPVSCSRTTRTGSLANPQQMEVSPC